MSEPSDATADAAPRTRAVVLTALGVVDGDIGQIYVPLAAALALSAAFIVVDLAFFGANLLKIAHGGWFPLMLRNARRAVDFFRIPSDRVVERGVKIEL